MADKQQWQGETKQTAPAIPVDAVAAAPALAATNLTEKLGIGAANKLALLTAN